MLTVREIGGKPVFFVLEMEDLQKLNRLFRNLILSLPERLCAKRCRNEAIRNVLGKCCLYVVQHRHIMEQTNVLEGSGNTGLHELVGLLAV